MSDCGHVFIYWLLILSGGTIRRTALLPTGNDLQHRPELLRVNLLHGLDAGIDREPEKTLSTVRHYHE